MRASHVGVASRNIGAITNDSSRCWIMWTKYRYSSEMSCIGQSVANHSVSTAATNHRFWPLVTTTSSGWVATGPTRLAAYTPSAEMPRMSTQISGCGWKRNGCTSAAPNSITSAREVVERRQRHDVDRDRQHDAGDEHAGEQVAV